MSDVTLIDYTMSDVTLIDYTMMGTALLLPDEKTEGLEVRK